MQLSSVVTFIMHYINAPHVHLDADTRIKCTHSHFQEVTPTSVQLATGRCVYHSLIIARCGSARCRPLQQLSSHNYSQGKRLTSWMEGDGQQPDNSPSASSGQAALGDRLQLTAPSMFKAVGLGGGLHPSQRSLWEASQLLDTSCQASSQQIL